MQDGAALHKINDWTLFNFCTKPTTLKQRYNKGANPWWLLIQLFHILCPATVRGQFTQGSCGLRTQYVPYLYGIINANVNQGHFYCMYAMHGYWVYGLGKATCYLFFVSMSGLCSGLVNKLFSYRLIEVQASVLGGVLTLTFLRNFRV